MTVIELAASMKITRQSPTRSRHPGGALESLYVAGSVGRIDRQFGVDALADIGRKLEPLTGRSGREGTRFHSHIAKSDKQAHQIMLTSIWAPLRRDFCLQTAERGKPVK
jgi:hypothetical protein